MKIVDKYILRQLIVAFLLVLTSLTLLVWLTQSLRMIDMVVSKGASVGVFLKITVLALPNFLQILMPLALFAVILFVFIRMQSDKELMVFKAIGMSSKQLIRPVMYMVAVLICIGYFFSFWVIPESTNEMRAMKWKIKNDLSSFFLQEGQFNPVKKGMMIYVKERLPDGGIKGVLAYEIKDGKKSVLIAEEGTIFQTKEGFDVLFGQGARQEYNPKTKQFSVLKFNKYTISINDHAQTDNSRIQKANELPLMTLLKTTKEQAPSLPMWRNYKVEVFKRLTQPLYTLVFALLALAGVLTGFYNRRGQSGRINLVIGSALLIQTCDLAFENMSGKNLWFMSLMAANIFIPLVVLYRIFRKEDGLKVARFWAFLLTLGLAFSSQAFVDIKVDSFEKKQPIDFSSDKVSYDTKTQIMTASGQVQLRQNGMLFETEKIYYDQNQDMVHIPGKALMTLPDGNKSYLSDIRLYPQKNEVVTGPTTIDFIDGSKLWADHVIRYGEAKENVLKGAYYTPCESCENSSALWQLHASSVEQDENEHLMRFWNTFLEIKDVPVFYFPYFQMPDSTVKRKTGFLLPSIGSDSTIDRYIKLPYFIDLSKNQNLTLTPVLSTSQDPVGIVQYNGLFRQGEFNFNGSLTKDEDKKTQGHVKADFVYNLSHQWRLSGQYFRTISDTYFRRYSVLQMDDSQSFLTSNLKTEYYGNRLQGLANFYHFQSLQYGVDSDTIPVVLPTFQVNYNTAPFTEQGGDFYTQLSGAFINDRTHFKSNRLTLEQGVRVPYKTSFGLVTNWQAMLRMDGYSIHASEDGRFTNRQNDSYWAGRVMPQGVLKMSYPLVKYGQSMTQILEPIMMIIVAPNGGNSDKIPNIDSTVFDFNDINLFSTDRYAGYDRLETGTRANYGVQWSLYPKGKVPSVQVLFGQSYRLRSEDDLSDPMGYKNHFSSYVGHVKLSYEYALLMYRFRLEEETFSPQKNDIVFEVGSKPLRLGIDYLFQDDYSLGEQKFQSKKEMTLYARSQLSQKWSFYGKYRYNLKKEEKGALEASGTLRYDHDCAAIEMTARKSFTKDRNYQGNTSIALRLYLKTLGGVGQ